MSILNRLYEKSLISPPKWLIHNVHYLVQMGSEAYGVSTDKSDKDMYGFCIPHKEDIFPHLRNEIFGYDMKVRFEQWQQHHIKDTDARKEYDFTIFGILKYFVLLKDNNPNIIDSLFVPERCISHITSIGTMIREKRHMFLHKGAWHRFKGYSYSQMHKMKIKNPTGKRKELIINHGYDSKFGYQVVRLLNEIEQILTEGTLDLERNREQLKSIRRGEWTLEQIEQYFQDKETQLEKLYNESSLPHSPDEDEIKELLFNCLEHHFGSLTDCIMKENMLVKALRKIEDITSEALHGYGK